MAVTPTSEIQGAIGLLNGQPSARDALITLNTIVKRLIESPSNPKFRRLRVSNARLQGSLLSLRGGSDVLLAIGFVQENEGAFLCRPLESPAAALREAAQAIEDALRLRPSTEAADRDTASSSTDAVDTADDDTDPMTAAQLLTRWQSSAVAKKKVVGFYSDKESAGEWRVFSNFSQHAAWQFAIPLCCGRAELARAGRPTTVGITYAERGIMLCKAAAMGDFAMYDEILAASSPASAKQLGRCVSPWDQARHHQRPQPRLLTLTPHPDSSPRLHSLPRQQPHAQS